MHGLSCRPLQLKPKWKGGKRLTFDTGEPAVKQQDRQSAHGLRTSFVLHSDLSDPLDFSITLLSKLIETNKRSFAPFIKHTPQVF